MLEAGLSTTLEREVLLDPGTLEVPEEVGDRAFVSVYHDTPQRRLARAGLELCSRTEEGETRWRLTIPRGDAQLVVDAPPENLSSVLRGVVRDASVEPVLELRTQRTQWVERLDGGVAEVALELVEVVEDDRAAARYRQLGVRLLEGEPATLDQLEARLRERGAADRRRTPAAPPRDDLSAVGLVRRMVADQYAEILLHDPGLRVGGEPEDVHRLRVAVRRLRATLRTARPLLDETWAEATRAELKWLGSALGPLRDLDVMVAHVRRDGSNPEVAEALGGERGVLHDAARETLSDSRYLALLDELERAAEALPVRSSEIDLRDAAAGEFRKLRRAARAAGSEPDDDTLHRLRIRAKRARYAAELVEPAVGAPAARFVGVAKNFQDVVGEHQDAVVAEARLRELVPGATEPSASFELGRLVERQSGRRRAARAAFPDAWEKLERRGRKTWR